MKKIITTALLITAITAQAQMHARWTEQYVAPELSNKLYSLSATANTQSEALQYDVAIDNSTAIDEKNVGYKETSRQYWLDVSATELINGVSLPLTSGTAVMRISPTSPHSDASISATQLQVSVADVPLQVESFAQYDDLVRTGAVFPQHTVAFKVKTPRSGIAQLKINQLKTRSNSTYVINVIEPNSTVALNLSTDHQVYSAGSEILVNAQLKDGKSPLSAQIQGYIQAPDGSRFADLDFRLMPDNSYQASITISEGQPLLHGLWEVHTLAESQNKGSKVMRDAQSSFAVTYNSARFDGSLEINNNHLSLGIEVAQAGRYEVKALLMGSDSSGKLQAAAYLMSADWLAAGTQQLQLSLRQIAQLQQTGLSAPYAVKNIQLVNQSTLSPVQRVDSGIKLSVAK